MRIITCEHDAMTLRLTPMEGAHATSLTQSECASNLASSIQRASFWSKRQTFTRLSQPPDTNRRTPLVELVRGAQLT